MTHLSGDKLTLLTSFFKNWAQTANVTFIHKTKIFQYFTKRIKRLCNGEENMTLPLLFSLSFSNPHPKSIKLNHRLVWKNNYPNMFRQVIVTFQWAAYFKLELFVASLFFLVLFPILSMHQPQFFLFIETTYNNRNKAQAGGGRQVNIFILPPTFGRL